MVSAQGGIESQDATWSKNLNYHWVRFRPKQKLHNNYNKISPRRSFSPASIRAECVPNCIARFFRLLANLRPTLWATNRSNILSPKPSASCGSILTFAGSPQRYSTTDRDKKGCLVSFPCDDITLSSRPRFLIGILSISSCNCDGRKISDTPLNYPYPYIPRRERHPIHQYCMQSCVFHIPQEVHQIPNRSATISK